MTLRTHPAIKAPRERGIRWLVTVVAFWLAAPFALILALTIVAQQQSVYGADEPTWVAAEEAGASSDRRIELELTWGLPETVFAPSWAGTVREVLVGPGSTVKSGDTVVRVDGILRIAWHSAAPFYRSLAHGDRGDDVAALNALLAARGLPAANGDLFTWATRNGTTTLARELGAGKSVSVFDPSMVLYLPADELVLAEVHLTVGAPAPGPGAPLLLSKPPLARGVLVEVGAAERATAKAIVAESNEVLFVGGAMKELVDGRSEVADTALATLAGEVASGQERVAAVLSRDLPEGSIQIPSAAVHTDNDGATCVAVRRGDVELRIRVVVVGGLAGQAVVTGAVSDEDLIGVGALKATARCAS